MNIAIILISLTCMILVIMQIIGAVTLKTYAAEINRLSDEHDKLLRDNLFLMHEIEKQARAVIDYQTKNEVELEHVQTRLDVCWKQTADICRRYVLYRSAENEIDHIERAI